MIYPIIIMTVGLLLLSPIALSQGEGESDSTKARWDERYDRDMYIYGKEPAAFLIQKMDELKKGKVLVLAMGEGRNAVYLAQNGFDVTGVDISEVAIEKCNRLAKERNTTVNAVVADLTDYDMGEGQFDLITKFYYYEPSIFPQIIDALKPGGMFILEQFSIDHLKYRETSSFGPRNPDYLIKTQRTLGTLQVVADTLL